MEYLVVFEKAADGSMWARVSYLEACHSCGNTIENAKEHVKDAITLYLEDFKRWQINTQAKPFKSGAYRNMI